MKDREGKRELKVTLVGAGCAPGMLTEKAAAAVNNADLLIGAERILNILPEDGREREAEYRPLKILDILKQRRPEEACVLLSGDSGFFSGAEKLIPVLEGNGIDTEVLPGISSLQYFAAAAGRAWQGWRTCSAHGAGCDPVCEVMYGKPVFFITSGSGGPASLCRELSEAGLGDLGVTVGSDLGYDTEKVFCGSAREAAGMVFPALNVMLAEAAPVYGGRRYGIPDDEFIRGGVPMTKQETRCVIASVFSDAKRDVCWDIGAGTGSVSVEMALNSGRVYAVEHDPEALGLIRENKKKFRAWNLHITEGRAPEILDTLPDPDAVFIGGSGGRIRDIIRTAFERNAGVFVCVTAATLTTLNEALQTLEECGASADAVQIQANRLIKKTGHRMLAANNPVFVISGSVKDAL